MEHPDGHGPFAHGDRDALYRRGAAITDAEHAGSACLQRERRLAAGFAAAGGWASGAPSTNDRDLSAGAESRLGWRGGVEGAHPLELLEPVERQPAVAGAHRQHSGPGLNAGPVIEAEHMMAAVPRQRNRLSRTTTNS